MENLLYVLIALGIIATEIAVIHLVDHFHPFGLKINWDK